MHVCLGFVHQKLQHTSLLCAYQHGYCLAVGLPLQAKQQQQCLWGARQHWQLSARMTLGSPTRQAAQEHAMPTIYMSHCCWQQTQPAKKRSSSCRVKALWQCQASSSWTQQQQQQLWCIHNSKRSSRIGAQW